MKLEYIKINDKIYNLNTKLVVFLGGQNSGKTMLFRLIKFIYGAEKDSTIDSSPFINYFNKHLDEIIEWKFVESVDVYTLNYKEKKITTKNSSLSYEDYRRIILSNQGFSHNVFGRNLKTIESFSFDRDIVKELDSNNYGKFFAIHNDMTYTAVKYLMLLDSGVIQESILNYFSKIGQKKNIEKIKQASSKLYNDYDSDLVKLFSTNENLSINQYRRYINLSKMKKRELDNTIIEQIKELNPDIPIDEIINFHDKLIDSYNEVIDSEVEELKKDDEIIKSYSKQEMKDFLSYYDINKEMQIKIKDIEATIKSNKDIIKDFNNKIASISKEMNLWCKNKNHSLNNNYEYINKIYQKEDRFVVDFRKDSSKPKEPGAGDLVINFINGITYSFIKSTFPIMVFEKIFLSEIENVRLIKLADLFLKIIPDDKQVIFFLHPDKEFLELKSDRDVKYYYVDSSNKFFGKTF